MEGCLSVVHGGDETGSRRMLTYIFSLPDKVHSIAQDRDGVVKCGLRRIVALLCNRRGLPGVRQRERYPRKILKGSQQS